MGPIPVLGNVSMPHLQSLCFLEAGPQPPDFPFCSACLGTGHSVCQSQEDLETTMRVGGVGRENI